jgi:hypothetical protein
MKALKIRLFGYELGIILAAYLLGTDLSSYFTTFEIKDLVSSGIEIIAITSFVLVQLSILNQFFKENTK